MYDRDGLLAYVCGRGRVLCLLKQVVQVRVLLLVLVENESARIAMMAERKVVVLLLFLSNCSTEKCL